MFGCKTVFLKRALSLNWFSCRVTVIPLSGDRGRRRRRAKHLHLVWKRRPSLATRFRVQSFYSNNAKFDLLLLKCCWTRGHMSLRVEWATRCQLAGVGHVRRRRGFIVWSIKTLNNFKGQFVLWKVYSFRFGVLYCFCLSCILKLS